jgi:hypothetical protein
MEQARQEERAARNQALFREVNDRIAELDQLFDELTPYGSWACECANVDCMEPLQMTLGEYEELRKVPTHFAVLPSEEHVVPEIERVVEKTARYWVVEKVGHAGEVAAEQSESFA